MADHHRITPALVGRLVKAHRADPFFLSKKLERQHTAGLKKEAIENVVRMMLEKNQPIESSHQVQKLVLEKTGQEVSMKMVQVTMRKSLGMSFRMAKKVPKQGNSERCLVLRQQYALRILPLMEKGRRIINVDESWLNETSFIRKLWQRRDENGSVATKIVNPRLSVLAAIDTDGHVWFALTQTNTDSDVLLLFFQGLLQKLDHQSPDWRDGTVFLLDGARYHTSAEIITHFEQLRVQVMFTAPYSYESSPIERLFAGLKLGELNQERGPTGKR